MALFIKQKIKIFLCAIVIIIACFSIYVQMKEPTISVSKILTDEKSSKIQVKSKITFDNNIKMYQKAEDDKQFTEVKPKESNNSILNKNNTFELETVDKAKPNNVTNINNSVLDNYIVISFKKAKDNGTEYEYYIEENNKDNKVKTEISKICNISGIKGYSYIIDNSPDTKADFEVNKIDSEPILYTGINWSKDYYLYIRAIDNSDNYSDNLTYKINLPSKGIRMKYIDINSNKEISPEETIVGNVNDEYNTYNYKKILNDYQLIDIDGEEIGTLKKERINVNYLYAKNANIVVKHLNKLTGEQIAEDTYINGYVGKEYNIIPKNIKNYQYNGGTLNGKMTLENNQIKLYYDEISNINVSYVDYLTGKNIIPSKTITKTVNSEYSEKEKEIFGYDLFETKGNTKGKLTSEGINIVYYYKKKANILIKHVDIDTNKILDSEILYGHEADKVIIKSKKFEGYVLKYDNKDNEEIPNSPKKEKTKEKMKNIVNINNNKENKINSNIIDEILETDEIVEIEEDTDPLLEHSFQEYDIVMGCGNKEYIIYYKKR